MFSQQPLHNKQYDMVFVRISLSVSMHIVLFLIDLGRTQSNKYQNILGIRQFAPIHQSNGVADTWICFAIVA